jgi:hypothetical protein
MATTGEWKFHYFMHQKNSTKNLKYAKKFNKMKNTNEIYQKIQNNPKFEQGVSNNVGWHQKK